MRGRERRKGVSSRGDLAWAPSFSLGLFPAPLKHALPLPLAGGFSPVLWQQKSTCLPATLRDPSVAPGNPDPCPSRWETARPCGRPPGKHGLHLLPRTRLCPENQPLSVQPPQAAPRPQLLRVSHSHAGLGASRSGSGRPLRRFLPGPSVALKRPTLLPYGSDSPLHGLCPQFPFPSPTLCPASHHL